MTKPSNRKDPNLKDLAGEMIPCPLCNKAIVLARPEHGCDRLLRGSEYISDKLDIRLAWSADNGWCSYHLTGELIEKLNFADVVNWTREKDSLFVAFSSLSWLV